MLTSRSPLAARGKSPARSHLPSPSLSTRPKLAVRPGTAAFHPSQEDQRLRRGSTRDFHHGLLGLAAIAALSLSFGGCGDLAPLDGSGETGGSSVPAEVEAAFAGSCATPGCHTGATPAGMLSLDAADLGTLTEKESNGLPMVEIGNVHGSYLALKMLPEDVLSANGLKISGNRMPPTADFTNPNNATILAWIAGAEFPDDGGDTDGTGSTGSTGSTGDGVLTFDGDVWPIFSVSCSCHFAAADPGANGDLSFPEADAYANLVGVASPSVPGLNLIEPNEPENSYLMNKLNNTQGEAGGSGTQMPPGGLSDAQIQLIEDWILAGAPE